VSSFREGGEAKLAIYGAEHALILLDCNPSMFECFIPRDYRDDADNTTERIFVRDGIEDGGNMEDDGQNSRQSPMEVALTAIIQLLRMRIRTVSESKTGKRNGVGVLLYGCDTLRGIHKDGRRHDGEEGDDGDDTEEDDEEEKILPSTHELLELVPPGIGQVETIRACLMNGGKKRRDLKKEFSIRRHHQMDGKGQSMEQEDDGARCLKSALHEANKVFMHAKLSFLNAPIFVRAASYLTVISRFQPCI